MKHIDPTLEINTLHQIDENIVKSFWDFAKNLNDTKKDAEKFSQTLLYVLSAQRRACARKARGCHILADTISDGEVYEAVANAPITHNTEIMKGVW